jgi:hypothetical protein
MSFAVLPRIPSLQRLAVLKTGTLQKTPYIQHVSKIRAKYE